MKSLDRIDADDLDPEVAGEHVHHHVAFVQAQQAVVDENAGQLVADGAVDQRCGNARIDAAGQTEDDFLVTDLLADRLDGFGDVVAHHPVGAATADAMHEAFEQRAALLGVGDFGVELDGVELARLVGHAGNRAGWRRLPS